MRWLQGLIVRPGVTVSIAAGPSFDSSMMTWRSGEMAVSSWTRPDGQRIVNLSIFVSRPRPKWTWFGAWE